MYEQETVLESGFHSDSDCYSGYGCIYDKEPSQYVILAMVAFMIKSQNIFKF